jgi:hypothetical protein
VLARQRHQAAKTGGKALERFPHTLAALPTLAAMRLLKHSAVCLHLAPHLSVAEITRKQP